MATDIVGSLFGVNPAAYQQAQQKQAYAQDYQAVNLDPLQQANLALRQGGRGLGQFAGGLMGMQDPELVKASQIKQLSTQFNLADPQGLRDFGNAIKEFAPQEAMQAIAAADEREKSSLGITKTKADIAVSERKVEQDEKLREALAALGDNPTEEQYLRVFRMYGSPDAQAKAIQASIDKRTARAAAAGTGVSGGGVNNNGVQVGTFDKMGRYKAPTGRVFTAKAVEDAQASHDNAQDLVDRLQNLTNDDINNAYGSVADYTTMTGGKLLGPTKTLNAQTKINEIGIRNVLTNLQKLKGASSDKEMAQMIKDFPGYQADPEIMREWTERATRVTNNFLSRSEKRFGFDTEYAQEGRFTSQGKTPTAKAGKAGSSRDNPIKLD